MLITLITTLAGLALGLWRGDPLLFGLLGLLLGRVVALDLVLRTLQQGLIDQRQRTVVAPDADGRAESADAPQERALSLDLDWAVDSADQPPGGSPTPDTQATPPAPAATPVDAWSDRVRDWLMTGNLFVRVGILLVFLGVGFLINYAVDQHWLVFTLELRLMAVALAAIGLLALGWWLRTRRRDYGLLLQGAAIGILYLDVYGAYQLADLLSATPAFALLTLIGLSAAALAIAQNAPSLAWFGFAGGFLAPIVAASGRDDHIALFSYYALLNAAILAVAWFKSWRALNLLGFGFTFGVAVLWGVLRYEPERFASTEPFLVLFFLFYVAITVLYAHRQPPRLRGYIDSTLLFGTPILAFACQVELVRHIPDGIAWSAAILGGFYLVLAGLLPRRAGTGFGLLARAFLALGIIFLSVAVPFALAADTTAGVWALEGAALVWIGSRQGRPSARAFGLILQAGAALALIAGLPYPVAQPFVNSAYLGAAMIAIAGCVSAYWLDRSDTARAGWERGGAPWLLIWGLAWWFGGGTVELLREDSSAALPAALLGYGILTLVLSEAVASFVSWPRLHQAQAALPTLGLAALALSPERVAHPALDGGALAWPLYCIIGYLVLARIEQRETRPYLAWSHTALALLLIAVMEWELVWRAFEQATLVQGWRVAAVALIPLVGLLGLTTWRRWPLTAWRFVYKVVVGSVLVFALVFWTLWSSRLPSGATPLPWLPVLNPLDGMLALLLLAVWRWWQELVRGGLIHPTDGEHQAAWMLFGSLAFLWINLALLRTLHHIWLIPYEWDALFRSDLAQTALAVLWGLIGVALLLLARIRRSRVLWIAGAVVLAAVVIKLFAVDLAASGTVERIVSFLAVGALLVGIGWWSPLPPRDRAARVSAGDARPVG